MPEKLPRRGVVICGAYGLGNAGDEATLAAVCAALRRLDPDLPVTVLSRRPKETARRFGVEAVHPLRLSGVAAALRRARLFLHGGGSLLQDVTSRRSLWYYLLTLRLAKRLGCAVMLYGCGLGPLSRPGSRRMTARVLNECADVIALRDGDSAALLEKLGVTAPRVLLTADPALGLDTREGGREQRFGVALRPWPGFRRQAPAIAAAVRYVWETYRLEPVFFCLGPDDRTAAQAVCGSLGDVPYRFSIDSGRVGRMSLVLSMRLHGLIFALGGGAPAAGIDYDPKVRAFCGEAGLPRVPLESLDADRLCRALDEAAQLDADRLYAEKERLRRREQGNIAAAAQLLSEGDGL